MTANRSERGISAQQLVSSPACIPQMTLEEILPAYRELGFTKFEAFSEWCKSHLDLGRDPAEYVRFAEQHGLRYTSMHLPPVTEEVEATVKRAVDAARFGHAIGAKVVLFKAKSRELYIEGGKRFLDELEAAKVPVTPVLQNHKGTPITTLDDFHAVIEGISDPRMKTLLEVGHFKRVGATWREGYDLLGDSIALVHINEIDADGQSVPYGTGTVDFPGLFEHLGRIGYAGDIVIELELATRNDDAQRTLRYLGEALKYLHEHCVKD